MSKPKLSHYYSRLVNALSFSSELQKLRRDLNARIDAPSTIEPGPSSHPLGVSRSFKRRRISIAEAYLMVVRDLESQHAKARLRALRMMMDVSLHAKTLDLPLNTARVQMALIKGAIKNRNDKRKQLELLYDFSISAHGQNQVIRKLLNELNIIELPETGDRLKKLGAGWDGHVHDTSTSGRKNPTQLLLDAFIKGISELTIAYSSASSIAMMTEAVDAGKIVGIRVSIGLEFSAIAQGSRFHFMAVLPPFKNGKETTRWFNEHADGLEELFDGLEKNQDNRIESVHALLKHFNENELETLNAGFPSGKLYRLHRLKMKDLMSVMPRASINRMNLGEFMYARYRPILFNRVMLLKARYQTALLRHRQRLLQDSELSAIEREYAAARAHYTGLDPEQLRKDYFSNPAIADYHTVFSDLKKLKTMLSEAGCAIRMLQPLEHGLQKAKEIVNESRGIIDEIEIYNVQDSADRAPAELIEFARIVNDHNAECDRAGLAPYVPVCGSDSTGRNPKVPGMGFIREDRLLGKFRRGYAARHRALPAIVSAMIEAGKKPVAEEAIASAPIILCMGKTSSDYRVHIGDEGESGLEAIPPSRAWRYLNPGLINFVHALIGFLVARRFIGAPYALLWLAITGFRNSIADLVASRGTRIREWNLKSVNFENVARSLFWTGFSVPILGFVKARFDVLWPGPTEGVLFEAVKFFAISFCNGLYLATHNTLRGFDKKVVRVNFFRSILAWPFATVTAPLGTLLGIPSIVQAKIWSDFVAGFIEGSGKYLAVIKLRRRDLEEIIPQVISGEEEERFVALLDLLYLYREEPRMASSLATILAIKRHSFGIFLADSDEKPCTYDELLDAVMDERLDSGFIDFILSRYAPEMSVELLDLATTVLPSFRSWLGAHARRFRRA
ncbi:MAG: hypothetical protein CVV47_15510 [Spirochaetae bacterium HGW-Spirochaetae-3]|jgi:hypothetical protein|nr:MAG: hypothetical protein CVV47_15510 [Spirochaetae bacterium HGW-Spirochaetae-3]